MLLTAGRFWSPVRTFCCIGAGCVALWFGQAGFADDAEESASADEPTWAASVASLGDGEFLVGMADGLLLRPSDVATVHRSDLSAVQNRYKHDVSVWSTAVSVDGRRAATADYRGNLAVYDRQAGEAKLFNEAGGSWTRALIFSPGGDTLLIGNEIGELIVWNVDSGEATKTVKLSESPIMAIAVVGGEQGNPEQSVRYLVCTGAGEVQLIDSEFQSLTTRSVSDESAMCVWTDGETVLVGCADRQIYELAIGGAGDQTAFSEPRLRGNANDWVTAIVASEGRMYASDLSGQIMELADQSVAIEPIDVAKEESTENSESDANAEATDADDESSETPESDSSEPQTADADDTNADDSDTDDSDTDDSAADDSDASDSTADDPDVGQSEPSVAAKRTVTLPSAVWDLAVDGDTIVAATRRHGLQPVSMSDDDQ